MKKNTSSLISHLAFLSSCLFSLAAFPTVPIRWQVDTARIDTPLFEAFHGESIAIEAAFNAYGSPIDCASQSATLYYQTNGMASSWWSKPASVSSNVARALFTPSMDPGAKQIRLFIALADSTSNLNYRANARIIFKDSPGYTPNALTPPVSTLDLSKTTVIDPPWPTTNDFVNATNALISSLSSYVDSQIISAGVITPDAVTNIVEGKLASLSTSSVDTNSVKAIINSEVGGTNTVTHGGPYLVTSSENGSIGYTEDGEHIYISGGDTTVIFGEPGGEYINFGGAKILLGFDKIYESTEDSMSLWQSILAVSNGIVTASADAYYPKSSGEAWSTYWDGDDVRVTVTNYDSQVNIPSLYLEQRTNEVAQATNLFRTVWREMAHWDSFLGTNWNWRAAWCGFGDWCNAVTNALEEKADRAWGFYDSHTGEYAPDAYTSISSSNVMISAGMSYQKTLTSNSEVWVLTANEPYSPCGISTNGGFQIKDADGNVQFEIVKGDKVTLAAQANAVTVDDDTLVVTYNVVAEAHPTAEVCLDLTELDWKSEDDADCPATVTWTGSSGAYVARITPNASTNRCFCKASYTRGGATYVNHRTPVGLSKIVLNGTTYTLGTATISGNTVLTLTPSN